MAVSVQPHEAAGGAAGQDVPQRLGLGVALDMPWMGRGFQVGPPGTDPLGAATRRFFAAYQGRFDYSLLAFQPRDHGRLEASSYVEAYDAFFEASGCDRRAFHQTTLNLASPEAYDRSAILAVTNELAARYRFEWVVEDLAFWSVRGRALPYPLPPFLTDEGVAWCIDNVTEVQRALDVPLHIEFPGFTEGASFRIGSMDALDHFRHVAEGTGSFVTIDVGHVLGYLVMEGLDFAAIDRLPLDRCRELHLAGCTFRDGRFRDVHHGILLDEQIELTELLLERCPNLVGVTYEDPRFGLDGLLVPRSVPNFERLEQLVGRWKGRA